MIMGINMYEIKKSDANNPIWRDSVRIYIECFLPDFKDDTEYLNECCEEYIKYIGNAEIWYAAIANKCTVGFAWLRTKNRKYCHVDFIGVDPSLQSKGYGKQMMEFLSKHYEIIELGAVPEVQGIYKKCGFAKENIFTNENEMEKYVAKMFKVNPKSKDDMDALKIRKQIGKIAIKKIKRRHSM